DRPDDARGRDVDLVARHGDVIPARGGHRANADPHRLLLSDALHPAPDHLAGRGRTAGGVDADDDALDQVVVFHFAQRFADGAAAYGSAAEEPSLGRLAVDD